MEKGKGFYDNRRDARFCASDENVIMEETQNLASLQSMGLFHIVFLRHFLVNVYQVVRFTIMVKYLLPCV